MPGDAHRLGHRREDRLGLDDLARLVERQPGERLLLVGAEDEAALVVLGEADPRALRRTVGLGDDLDLEAVQRLNHVVRVGGILRHRIEHASAPGARRRRRRGCPAGDATGGPCCPAGWTRTGTRALMTSAIRMLARGSAIGSGRLGASVGDPAVISSSVAFAATAALYTRGSAKSPAAVNRAVFHTAETRRNPQPLATVYTLWHGSPRLTGRVFGAPLFRRESASLRAGSNAVSS